MTNKFRFLALMALDWTLDKVYFFILKYIFWAQKLKF
jgi:hypothetical protein